MLVSERIMCDSTPLIIIPGGTSSSHLAFSHNYNIHLACDLCSRLLFLSAFVLNHPDLLRQRLFSIPSTRAPAAAVQLTNNIVYKLRQSTQHADYSNSSFENRPKRILGMR